MFFDDPTKRVDVSNKLLETIKQLRTKRGCSIKEITLELKRPQSWLAQIESGRTRTIRNIDLIQLFSVLLEATEDESKQYLIENYETLFVQTEAQEDNEDIGFDKKSTDNEPISVFEPKSETDTEKFKVQYQKSIENISTGYEVFFERMQNKEKALKMMVLLMRNLHSDLGLMMSITALPFFKLGKDDYATKEKLFHDLYNVIEKYTSTEDHEPNEDSKK